MINILPIMKNSKMQMCVYRELKKLVVPFIQRSPFWIYKHLFKRVNYRNNNSVDRFFLNWFTWFYWILYFYGIIYSSFAVFCLNGNRQLKFQRALIKQKRINFSHISRNRNLRLDACSGNIKIYVEQFCWQVAIKVCPWKPS